MTKVGYGNMTVDKGRQWEESGVSVKNVWHHCCQWWQVKHALSPYRVIKRISGQTGVSLYCSVVAAVTVRRYTRTLSRGATRSAVQQLRLSAA